MPIKWSGLKVIEAMEMAEEFINQAIEPLEQALLVAEEAARIPDLPNYMKDRICRLTDELKRATGGVMYGQQMQSRIMASVDAVRDAVPKDAVEGELSRAKAGTQQALI